MDSTRVCYCVIASLLIAQALCRGQDNILTQIATKLQKNIRPPGFNDTLYQQGPVLIKMGLEVHRVFEVDDRTQTIRLELSVTADWTDSRLRFARQPDIEQFSSRLLQTLWTPNLQLQNEIPQSNLMIDLFGLSTAMKLSPNGHVQLSRRFTTTVFCNLDLANFPFDKHVCSFRISSYVYESRDVLLGWRKLDPIRLEATPLLTPSFKIRSIDFGDFNCFQEGTSTGIFSCIEFKLHLARRSGHYVHHWLLPAFIWIAVAWFSLWFDAQTQLALRLVVSVVPVIMLSSKIIAINNQAPISASLRTLDIWTGWCFAFALIPLMELLIAHQVLPLVNLNDDQEKKAIKRKKREERRRSWLEKLNASKTATTVGEELETNLVSLTESDRNLASGSTVVTLDNGLEVRPTQLELLSLRMSKLVSRVNSNLDGRPLGVKIDLVLRVLHPVSFVLFNICFWLARL